MGRAGVPYERGGRGPAGSRGPERAAGRPPGPLLDMVGEHDVPTRLMREDAPSYLPGDILTTVDRMSTAVSLEARVLMLDREVGESAFSLSSRLKFRTGEEKGILREATRDLLLDAGTIAA